MNPGEAFEKRCFEFLKNTYGKKGLVFQTKGGMDSTQSDIAVLKGGEVAFYIEAKDALAQSGQFVLTPDNQSETFIFSPRNRSRKNDLVEDMMNYMAKHFDQFCNAGTAGEQLDIPSDIFAKWIIGHYKERNVKYVISYDRNNGYVILPIRKFASYFSISATYRIKKSGSGAPARKNFTIIEETVKDMYSNAKISVKGKKLYADIPEPLSQNSFELDSFTYLFSSQEQDTSLYEIRKLSNTKNKNVIFSIMLKRSQDPCDLEEFISDLYSA